MSQFRDIYFNFTLSFYNFPNGKEPHLQQIGNCALTVNVDVDRK